MRQVTVSYRCDLQGHSNNDTLRCIAASLVEMVERSECRLQKIDILGLSITSEQLTRLFEHSPSLVDLLLEAPERLDSEFTSSRCKSLVFPQSDISESRRGLLPCLSIQDYHSEEMDFCYGPDSL